MRSVESGDTPPLLPLMEASSPRSLHLGRARYFTSGRTTDAQAVRFSDIEDLRHRVIAGRLATAIIKALSSTPKTSRTRITYAGRAAR